MSWISTNNLRRFADKLFHGNLSFGGSVTHNGATTFNGGVKVNTTKAEFAAPVSFTGTTTYKGNEVVTKNEIDGVLKNPDGWYELTAPGNLMDFYFMGTYGGGSHGRISHNTYYEILQSVFDEIYAAKKDTYTKTEVDAKIPSVNTSELIDIFYPVGTIYISADKTKTKADFPFMRYGTWEEVPANLCLQTGAASEAGTQRSAGLPNITGNIGVGSPWEPNGAIYKSKIKQKRASPSVDVYLLAFDASKSNSIYGSSNTVQPPAYMVRAWVRVA